MNLHTTMSQSSILVTTLQRLFPMLYDIIIQHFLIQLYKLYIYIYIYIYIYNSIFIFSFLSFTFLCIFSKSAQCVRAVNIHMMNNIKMLLFLTQLFKSYIYIYIYIYIWTWKKKWCVYFFFMSLSLVIILLHDNT